MTYKIDWIIAAESAGKKKVTGSAEYPSLQAAQMRKDAVKQMYPSAHVTGPYKIVYSVPEERAAQ